MRHTTKGLNLPVPQTDEDAISAIAEIGRLQRQVDALKVELDDKISGLKEEYGHQITPLSQTLKARQEGLKAYCEANRDRLTNGGKVKFHQFATGRISWRLRPAKVSLRGVDGVIAAIQSLGLGARFLRTKHEVRKDALLEERETALTIPGVAIGTEGEDFIVEPDETKAPS